MKSQSDSKTLTVATISKTEKCKVVKGARPLVNFKFYLDIANHQISSKVERKITEFGGSIEFFISDSVTHFVTDKTVNKDNNTAVNSPCTPSTAPSSSLSTCDLLQSNDLKGEPKIKSRADAMLHRARSAAYGSLEKFASIPKSQLQVAKSRGIPIWDTDHVLRFLEKVSDAIKNHISNKASKANSRQGNAKILKGDFIKIEAIQGSHRPYYHIFKKDEWPIINLSSPRDVSVFQCAIGPANSENKTRNGERQKSTLNPLEMTRKNRSSKHIGVETDRKIPSAKQCGYCELCGVDYDVLSAHLKTDEHINFVNNESNFLELDTLIGSNTNIETFLNINKSKVYKDTDYGMHPKRASKRKAVAGRLKNASLSQDISKNRVRQTRQSAVRQSDPICDNQFSSESGSRARRESVKKVNYAEPKEDEENSNDMLIEVPQKIKSRAGAKNVKPIIDSSPPRPKPKTPLMYKVVDTKDVNAADKKEPLTEKNNEQSLIVKFKKIREAEIAVLNGEAENFMFPKKFSNDISTDVDRHTSSELRGPSSSIISSCKSRKISIGSHTNTSLNYSDTPKRRKCTSQDNRAHATMTSSSRSNKCSDQSFYRSPIQPRKRAVQCKQLNSNNNIELELQEDSAVGEIKPTNLREILDGDLKQYKFSFERIPTTEIWYEVFQRQDESREKMFEYYGNTAYRKLPYEMGPLPPKNDPHCQICMSKRPTVKHPDVSTMNIKDIESPNKNTTEQKNIQITNSDIKKKKYKTKPLLNIEMPRKSPREHASTLAILSCLMQRSEKSTKNDDSSVCEFGSIDAAMDEAQEFKEKTEVIEKQPEVTLNISTQISENVKRLRRGEKLKAAKMLEREKLFVKTPTKKTINNKKRKYNKQLRFNMDESNSDNQKESFVNVHKLKQEIDQYLTSSFGEEEEELNQDIAASTAETVNQFSFDFNLEDLILNANSTKIDSKVCGRTKAAGSKLRLFNIFSTNKKRKNKTGWPTKKRTITRHPPKNEKLAMRLRCAKTDLSIMELNHPRDNKPGVISNQSPITPPQTDSEEKRPEVSAIAKDDSSSAFNYISTTEKPENSDIFTVSSDSLDTVLDVGSQMNTEDQEGIIESHKSNIKLTSINGSDKKCAENIYKKKYVKNRRSNFKRTISITQPDVSSIKTEGDNQEDLQTASQFLDGSTESGDLPKHDELNPINVSPRRLRKPRGKWYRER